MLRKISFRLLCLLMPAISLAQQTTEYPNDYLSPEFHAGRRAAFREMMPDNAVGVFFASQVRVRNNDVDYQYAQSKNFYYFTGLEEPNSLLLLFKKPVTILGATGTEFIFVQNRNPQQEMWTGKILGVEGVKNKYKIANVFTNDKFTANTLDLSAVDTVLTVYKGENILSKYGSRDQLSRMAGIVDSMITALKKPVGERTTGRIMTALRGIKQPEEIRLLEKAAAMSCEGHNDVMRAVKPGMTEYQAQAIMEYNFKKNGSEYPGYPSINGSSENSCVLHYVTNLRLMKDGDLLLSDCAAEYHGYTADVTRTIPVNGKFTPEQKLIYELVLEAQDSGFAACKPGNPFGAVDAAARRVINRGLIKLGIVANEQEARQYFPHGTSHHLGLDVHDMGPRTLMEGVCLTVEPGIYIPPGSNCDKKWWNIGVRIEDDILITKDGHRNLSASSPRTVAEIEKMAKQKSIFDK
ncbi:aminopeptidase P family protein [Sediminibacterium goheungense]|uniref:Xaa-Pro aminopeptidase n=1 Tax=Sediminibacterium goheungense TaxID=1086393 RepID=A0A4V3C586_9BACT|nr:aminopeptidase P family protein [Sediminibacterium goheungense]TDO28868.1 Xaa-Pro aminopeptidase [Sediminibacterium goheungense]